MKIQLLGVDTSFFRDIKAKLLKIAAQMDIKPVIEEIKDIDTILKVELKPYLLLPLMESGFGLYLPQKFNEEQLKQYLTNMKGNKVGELVTYFFPAPYQK